ncbi:MAG: AraC family transcriptional regulator [Verrucomicrobiae bacterium]|nr:AraC family transcriptional regulator [Verrucomicrobiae bacterium]
MKSIRYFFDAPPVDSPDISIHGIGIRERMRPGVVRRPRGTGDWLFMQFHGEVFIQTREGWGVHPENTLVIWTPRDGHQYGNPNKPWSHSWLHGEGRLIGKFLAESGLPAHAAISLPDAVTTDKHLLDLHYELTSHVRPDAVIARNILHNWIREIGRRFKWTESQVVAPPELMSLKSFVERNFDQPMNLAELAARAGLSVPHLCSQFKKCFGFSVIGYQIRLRLQRATYLLQDQGLRLKEVGRQVGYEDYYHFSKLFKEHYGFSPRAMRRAGTRLFHGKIGEVRLRDVRSGGK